MEKLKISLSAICCCCVVVSIIVMISMSDCAKSSPTIKCGKEGDQKVSLHLARLTVYSKKHGRNFPTNRKELKAFCKESSDLLYHIDQYRKQCFQGQLKQFASLFVFSNRNMIKRFCGKGTKTRRYNELFQMAQCVNKNKPKHDLCMEKLTEEFVGIKYAEDNKKIPHTCCTLNESLHCFRDQMVQDGCDTNPDLMEEILRSNFDSIGPLCGDYNEDSDRCSGLGKRPKKKPNEKVPDSIMMPFYDIVNSLPQ